MNHEAILIAESDLRLRNDLKGVLISQGFKVIDTPFKKNFQTLFYQEKPDLLIAGSCLDDHGDSLTLIEEIHQRNNTFPIILTTRQSTEDLAISALKMGVKDYFKVPICYEELVASVKRCLKESYIHAPTKFNVELSDLERSISMVGESKPMLGVKSYIRKLARTDSNVLITGETGTGKELAAEFLHECSQRRNESFVCVNCAALPENLIESELFGAEKGSFTGAVSTLHGKFEQADKGTIFLDEIGDMSPYAQAKILRAVETKKISRVGGKRDFPVNTRTVAATNQNLEILVAEKKFREDLYYRLNVGRLHMPSLRERKEDIPSLVDYYVNKLNKSTGLNVAGFSEESQQYMVHYDWPGNVRELKNVVESSFIDLQNRNVEFVTIPDHMKRKITEPLKYLTNERESLLKALHQTNWNKSRAAEKLNWSRMTLYRKMKKYKIGKN